MVIISIRGKLENAKPGGGHQRLLMFIISVHNLYYSILIRCNSKFPYNVIGHTGEPLNRFYLTCQAEGQGKDS